MSDFTVQNEGSVYILYAETDAAKEWVSDNLPLDITTWGTNGVVIEHRYIGGIVNGIKSDGLEVQ